MPQSLSFGPITIHFYGIFVGFGVLLSYLYCSKKSRYLGLNQKNIDYLFLITLPFSLLGARLYHIFSSWQYYQTNFPEMFNIQNGGLGIFGLLCGSFVGISISARLQKIKLFPCLNLVFPSFLLAQAIGRIGNFFNQEAMGPNNFPTFFLESSLCLVAFIVFLITKKKKLLNFGFANDTWTINGIKLGWIFSVMMFVTGLVVLYFS